uniref:Synaptobrevin, longin-like domain protein n=1 Tax=Tanacetum cinerariifolium TaxID=118510 RepID=A0A6L2LRH2_TANCI|nr:hypothetical protein [Tanacetum cinerariifolium]
MIVILEKYEHNQDFHQIVDFVEASYIRYALTFNPTVYVSHIRQFWSTARIKTTKEGTKILATVDGMLKTVSESSVRRNLKLNNETGISSLSDAEIFENLTLMGYNISPNQKFTFQKEQFSHQWKCLIYTIMQCLSPKSIRFNEFSSKIATALGEGSGAPIEPHHTPSPEVQQTSPTTHSSPSLPPVPTESLPTVIPTDTTLLRHYTKRARIARSLALLPVVDEPASPIGDDSQGEACPTDYGLEADQDRANIPKTSTLPSDSTPSVTYLAADEGSMQQKLDELMALCTSLQRQQSEMVFKFEAQELEINSLKARIKLLEDKDRGVAEQSGDDTPIKGRRLDEGEEAAKRVSDDTEEMTTVLTLMDAAKSTPYTRRKGKETMVDSETPKKKKVQEQIDVQLVRELEEEMIRYTQRMDEHIARDAEIARIHAEKELQMLIDGLDMNNKTAKDFKGMTLEEIKEKFDPVWKQIQDFILIGSKEETERFKRKGLRLEQESVKKLKTSEEVKATEEVSKENIRTATSDKKMELWVELKRLYEPDAEDQLWTHTQNMMHALIEWKLYDSCGVHHVTSKDKEIFMLVEKD